MGTHLPHLQREMDPLLQALFYDHLPTTILHPFLIPILHPYLRLMPSTFANRLEQPWTVELHPHTYTWLCVTTPIHFHKHVFQIHDEALEEFYFGNYSKLIFIGEQEGSLEASLLCLCACARYLISAVSRQAVQSMKGCTICRVCLSPPGRTQPQACC